MIVRIVKMTFREEEIENFKQVFDDSKEKIRAFSGVKYLECLQSKSQANIFFTYSHWQSEDDLEAYRNSDLFKRTWAKTKPLFKEKAEAWSNERLTSLK